MRVSNVPERLLLSVCAAVLIALLVGHLHQLRAVPGLLRYVPLENEGFLVTSPLNDLWRGLHPHLSSFFDDALAAPDPTEARSLALDLKRELDSKGIVLRSADDLAKLGIDGTLAAALALGHHDGTLQTLLAIPVLDPRVLTVTLERLAGEKALVLDGTPDPLIQIGEIILGFGPDGTALVTNSAGLLQRVLAGANDRLVQFRSNDRLGRAFTAPPPRTWGAQSTLLRGRLRLVDALPLSGEMHFALAADDVALSFEGRMALRPERARMIASLLERDAVEAEDDALARSDLAISVGSPSVSVLMQDLSSIRVSAGLEPLGGAFSPVLAELRDSDSLTRLIVVVSDANRRVPGLALGLQMASDSADGLVLRLQSSMRLVRDSEILRSASQYHGTQSDGDASPTPEALLELGLIAPEPGALWTRYQWDGMVATPTPAFSARDFAGEFYRRKNPAGLELRYLMPPFTDNDVQHRFVDDAEDLQIDELKANRYRLCSTYHGGTLWIGNDAAVLEHWMEQLRDKAPNPNFTEASALSRDRAGARLRAVAQPSKLLEAAQLYPDGKVNSVSRRWLVDLASYRIAFVGLSVDPDEQELYVQANLLRR